MLYSILADIVLLLHLGFILFVILGGFAVLRYPHVTWLHLPAVAWGVMVELAGWFCPLTDLENYWRVLSGAKGYDSSFIDRYLTPLIYPDGLSRTAQIGFALMVLGINLMVYGWLVRNKGKAAKGKSD